MRPRLALRRAGILAALLLPLALVVSQLGGQQPQKPAPTVTVYVTNTGNKYHSAGCQYLAKSSIRMSLEEAVKQRYGPCSKCRPPLFDFRFTDAGDDPPARPAAPPAVAATPEPPAPAEDLRRDPTKSGSGRLEEVMRTKAGSGVAVRRPPAIRVRARVIGADRPPRALLEIDGLNHSVTLTPDSSYTTPGGWVFQVLAITQDEVRLKSIDPPSDGEIIVP